MPFPTSVLRWEKTGGRARPSYMAHVGELVLTIDGETKRWSVTNGSKVVESGMHGTKEFYSGSNPARIGIESYLIRTQMMTKAGKRTNRPFPIVLHEEYVPVMKDHAHGSHRNL